MSQERVVILSFFSWRKKKQTRKTIYWKESGQTGHKKDYQLARAVIKHHQLVLGTKNNEPTNIKLTQYKPVYITTFIANDDDY